MNSPNHAPEPAAGERGASGGYPARDLLDQMQVGAGDLGVFDQEAVVRPVVHRPLGIFVSAVTGATCDVDGGQRLIA